MHLINFILLDNFEFPIKKWISSTWTFGNFVLSDGLFGCLFKLTSFSFPFFFFFKLVKYFHSPLQPLDLKKKKCKNIFWKEIYLFFHKRKLIICIIFKTKISKVSLWQFIFWKTREITSQLFRVLKSSSTFDINCWFLQKILLELEPQLCFSLLTEILACFSEFDCKIEYVDIMGLRNLFRDSSAFCYFWIIRTMKIFSLQKYFSKVKYFVSYICLSIYYESGSLWK